MGRKADNTYRYTLNRYLGPDRRTMLWIMLNPSTADEEKDDPTIRRVKSFTKREGYGRLAVVNLFAKRATDPKDLWPGVDPVGPGNGLTLVNAIESADLIVAAWGATKIPTVITRPNVEAMAQHYHKPMVCLGRNANGSPKHPLYLKDNTKMVPYP
jgi:hypothetical protein